MSKSTGNFVRLQTLMDWGVHPLVYRFYVLNATYRTPLLFNIEALVSAKTGLQRLLETVVLLKEQAKKEQESFDWLSIWRDHRSSRGGAFTNVIEMLKKPLGPEAEVWIDRLDDAVSDDLNTPKALSYLFQLLDERVLSADHVLRLVAIYDLVLGLNLLELTPGELNLRPVSLTISEAEIEARIKERAAARRNKDFRRADAIRDELREHGIRLRDTPEGTIWEYTPRVG